MLVENNENTRSVQRVVASMAIEEMYFDETFVKELIKIANGEKTSEQLRQEVIKKYAKH